MSATSVAVVGTALRASALVGQWVYRAVTADPSPLEAIDVDVSGVFDASDGGSIVVTHQQSKEISSFLADPAVVSLIQLAFLHNWSSDPAELEFLDEIASSENFQQLARNWCNARGQHWQDLAPELWNYIREGQDRILQGFHSRASEEWSHASDALVQRFFFGSLNQTRAPEYVRRLNEIAQNPGRQEALADVLSDCNRSDLGDAVKSFEIMGIEQDSASFDKLYIDRTLSDALTGASIPASAVLDVTLANPRAVVIGDPGVGKSTLTAWILWRIFEQKGARPPAVVNITCRHELIDLDSSVIEAVRKGLQARYIHGVDDQTMLDLLTTGNLLVVVDGIDEIPDPAHRSRIVKQLNRLADKYPFAPVIVTTRRTGFEVSVFEQRSFRVLSLEQYSETQVAEYAHKWFRGHSGGVKAERFIGESKSLAELRRNPLMLALLCTLFNQNDYIPESRRDIYLRCAYLMFFEWDPRRGIKIPNLFKNRGEAILREIALTLYQSGGVGASIDEKQLQKVIEGFLIPKGVGEIQARTAAAELIEHCSKRAWILSKIKTTKGVNHFAFTHRTFFEFFTAEALIRKISRESALSVKRNPGDRLSPVAREILNAYTADTTSVLPELLMQAAEDLMDGMSTPILEELQHEAARPNPRNLSSTQGAMQAWRARPDLLSLCIRLVAAGGASPIVVDRVFEMVEAKWSADARRLAGQDSDVHRTIDLQDLRRLLEISQSHRERFITRCVKAPSTLGMNFLQRYARLDLLGEAGLFDDDWLECARRVARSATPPSYDPVIVRFRVERGMDSLATGVARTQGADLLRLTVGIDAFPGLIWKALFRESKSVLKKSFGLLLQDDRTESLSGVPFADFAEIGKGAEGSTKNIPPEFRLLLVMLCQPAQRLRLASLLGATSVAATAEGFDIVEEVVDEMRGRVADFIDADHLILTIPEHMSRDDLLETTADLRLQLQRVKEAIPEAYALSERGPVPDWLISRFSLEWLEDWIAVLVEEVDSLPED